MIRNLDCLFVLIDIWDIKLNSFFGFLDFCNALVEAFGDSIRVIVTSLFFINFILFGKILGCVEILYKFWVFVVGVCKK